MAVRSHHGCLRRCRHTDGARPQEIAVVENATPAWEMAGRVPVELPRVPADEGARWGSRSTRLTATRPRQLDLASLERAIGLGVAAVTRCGWASTRSKHRSKRSLRCCGGS